MIYPIGGRVKLIGSDETWEVVQYEYKEMIRKDGRTTEKRYLIKKVGNNSSKKWVYEGQIKHSYDMSKELSNIVNKILIDVNLMKRNFDAVKQLLKEDEENDYRRKKKTDI